MWYKYVSLFQLVESVSYAPEKLEKQLSELVFKPCSKLAPISMGWTSPIDKEDAPLVHAANGFMLFCLKIEEKILPPAVIHEQLHEKVKQIEAKQERRVSQREKAALKDEITFSLLPHAFTKSTKLFMHIDTKNQWLIIDTGTSSKIDYVLETLRKTSRHIKTVLPSVIHLPTLMTHWLKTDNTPEAFVIEDACLLQDPNHEYTKVRCQHQDLFSKGVQSFVKTGYEVREMALTWRDQITFMIKDNFSLHQLHFHDLITTQTKDIHTETQIEQFDADFAIMTAALTELLHDLLHNIGKKDKSNHQNVHAEIIV